MKDRTYEIAKNRQYDEYQRALVSTFSDKKIGSGVSKLKNHINQQLKNSKEEKSMRDSKTIFGQQI